MTTDADSFTIKEDGVAATNFEIRNSNEIWLIDNSSRTSKPYVITVEATPLVENITVTVNHDKALLTLSATTKDQTEFSGLLEAITVAEVIEFSGNLSLTTNDHNIFELTTDNPPHLRIKQSVGGLDFEAPLGNSANVYTCTVTATDNNARIKTKSVQFTLTIKNTLDKLDVTWETVTLTIETDSNIKVGTVDTDDSGYNLSDTTNFYKDGLDIYIRANTLPEGNYPLTVTAERNTNLSRSITFRVDPPNVAPTLEFNNASFQESNTALTTAHTVTTINHTGDLTLRENDFPNNIFEIVTTNPPVLNVKAGTTLDFESPLGSSNNVYTCKLRATASNDPTNFTEKTFTLTVVDTIDEITVTQVDNLNLTNASGRTLVATVNAEGAYTLSDDEHYEIDTQNTTKVYIKATMTPGDYPLTIAMGNITRQLTTISVDTHPVTLTMDASLTVDEDATGKLLDIATDTDNMDFLILEGDADDKFEIRNQGSGTAELHLKNALDFETKTSHTVTVKVTNTYGGSAQVNFTLTVTNVVEVLTLTKIADVETTSGATKVATVDTDAPLSEIVLSDAAKFDLVQETVAATTTIYVRAKAGTFPRRALSVALAQQRLDSRVELGDDQVVPSSLYDQYHRHPNRGLRVRICVQHGDDEPARENFGRDRVHVGHCAALRVAGRLQIRCCIRKSVLYGRHRTG